MALNREYEQKLWNYIEALEKINEELLGALKQCVELLENIRGAVPEQHAVQRMLDFFHETIRVAEKRVDN
ncbi:MAG: hypothetical protein JRH18_15255 [Deltaproteobacteria bacterium]|nr:hypothetical protein [Deltaproteobacteria bacterium]MBW1993986.1 hypothetical protein [Deltaproteobacteria bacterium]MBW2153013.1 hypothetical protein [Deltaproteobacteria bacterium]